MARRSKADLERDREDVLLAIDELGDKATTVQIKHSLTEDVKHDWWSAEARVQADLYALERQGVIVKMRDPGQYWYVRWVRTENATVEIDEQEDRDDMARLMRDWEDDPAYLDTQVG